MNNPQITASIVLYNHKTDEINKGIYSFLNTDLRVELYLIINSAKVKISELVQDPRIKLIKSFNNPGFGAGHNLAIKEAVNSEYYLVLNPDVSFEKGVLEALYNFMEDNKGIGNVMPKVINADGLIQPLCKLLPTPLHLLSRRFFIWAGWAKRLNDEYELGEFDYNSIIEVPNLSGCFMFLRNSILQMAGGFDERYFLYLEDIDLNRRIAKLSKTIYYPYVNIKHKYNKESYTNIRLLVHHILSAIKYFNKWGWFFDSERKRINKLTYKAVQQKISEKNKTTL